MTWIPTHGRDGRLARVPGRLEWLICLGWLGTLGLQGRPAGRGEKIFMQFTVFGYKFNRPTFVALLFGVVLNKVNYI